MRQIMTSLIVVNFQQKVSISSSMALQDCMTLCQESTKDLLAEALVHMILLSTWLTIKVDRYCHLACSERI